LINFLYFTLVVRNIKAGSPTEIAFVNNLSIDRKLDAFVGHIAIVLPLQVIS
jgi:hypothetical protein